MSRSSAGRVGCEGWRRQGRGDMAMARREAGGVWGVGAAGRRREMETEGVWLVRGRGSTARLCGSRHGPAPKCRLDGDRGWMLVLNSKTTLSWRTCNQLLFIWRKPGALEVSIYACRTGLLALISDLTSSSITGTHATYDQPSRASKPSRHASDPILSGLHTPLPATNLILTRASTCTSSLATLPIGVKAQAR